MAKMLGAAHGWRRCHCWDCYHPGLRLVHKRAQRAKEKRLWRRGVDSFDVPPPIPAEYPMSSSLRDPEPGTTPPADFDG